MTKTIRKTYPRDFSIGVLAIIFVIVFFLSGQLFVKQPEVGFSSIYLGEFLVSAAVVIMVLIMWEDILFPLTIKPVDDGLLFRNHQTKLMVQVAIYLTIPTIVLFLYLTYEVSTFHFFAWAAVCLILPVVGKLVSGINNYHDFLKLTGTEIQYKNNEKEGIFSMKDVHRIQLVKDDSDLLQKLELKLTSGDPVTIDLDEMELEDFYDSIEEYVSNHYQAWLENR